MNTAIAINLDYPHLGEAAARRIWFAIEVAFINAGFTRNNRLFLSPLKPDEAAVVVREIVARLETELAAEGLSLYGALADFYAIDYLHTQNLLMPAPAAIDVQDEPPQPS